MGGKAVRRTKLIEVCGIVLSMMLFSATTLAAPFDIAEGLCFYLPFDGDANALVAKGNPMEMAEGIDAVFVQGKVGKAVHCGEGRKHRYLSYLTVSPNFAPNIRPDAGTLAFWVRPDWDGDEPVERYRHFLSIRSGLFYLYWHRGGLVFSSTMRKMARHLYAPSTSVKHWRKGEWHHVAVSWQITDPKERKGFKRLYVDGQKVAEASDVFLDFELTGALIIGGIDGEPQRIADAAIDEFIVWKRVLADEEIRQVWMMGEKGMALAQLPAVQKLAQQTQQQFRLAIQPQKGNLLFNSSFEVGSLHPWRASNMTLKPDETEKVHGNRSARFIVRGRTILTCGLFVARPQVAHTLSLWLKAERKGVRARFGVNSAYVAGTQPYSPIFRGIEGQGVLTTDWQCFTVTGILPPSPKGFYFVRAVFEAEEPTTVWIDAVQFEEGEKATPFKMRRDWEAGLGTDKPFNLFHPNEPVHMRLEVFSEVERKQPLILPIAVHDVWEQKVLSRQVKVRLRKGLTVLPLSFRLPLGSYRISVADEKGKVMDELVVAVLPRFESPDERMGIHVGANETGVMLAKALGCGWVRLLDACGVTHWDVVEPERGKWAWEQTNWLDEAIETYRNAGLKILGLLFRTPLWASSGDSVNHPPKDLEAWRNYVRSVAQHFKGRIDAYEVWNEPYGLGLFAGKEELYLQMTRIAFEELRKVDPQVKVVAPCTYWSLDDIVRWTEVVLQKGLLEFVDVFSFHGYEGYRPNDFERIKRWSALDGKQRPIWNTEQGVVSESFYRFLPDAYDDPYTRWIATRPFSAKEAASAMVKAFVSTLMLCLEDETSAKPKWEGEAPAEPKIDAKFFQYWTVPEDTMLPRLKSMSLLEFDNALRPKAVAWAIAGWLLRDSEPEGFEHRNGLWLLHFTKANQRITVAWSEEGTQTLTLPKGAEVLTMMGNPIKFTGGKIAVGSEPIFVRQRRW